MIIKLLGKTINYNMLLSRVKQMWKLDGDLELIDLGYGYYVAKFANSDDRTKVMTGGPWKIMDHYLTVQRWKPNFRPSEAVVPSTAVWIHLPEFPLEFFKESIILLDTANQIGKPLRLDTTTSLATLVGHQIENCNLKIAADKAMKLTR